MEGDRATDGVLKARPTGDCVEGRPRSAGPYGISDSGDETSKICGEVCETNNGVAIRKLRSLSPELLVTCTVVSLTEREDAVEAIVTMIG